MKTSMPTCDDLGPYGAECDRDPGHCGDHSGWGAAGLGLRVFWTTRHTAVSLKEALEAEGYHLPDDELARVAKAVKP